MKTFIAIVILLFPFFLRAQELDILILNSEYDKALQIIDSALIKEEAQPLLYLKKGIILQKRFDFTGAIKSLERGYQLDSLNSKILNELGEVNSNLGDHKKALSYFKELYRTDTTNYVYALKLVRAFSNLRMYQEPFEILISAYQRDSTNLLVNKHLALCAARTDHPDLAISLYQKVIDLNPTDPANYTNLASVYQNKDQYSEAIEILEKGLEYFPDDPYLLLKLGQFRHHLKEYKLAIIPYEKYLSKSDSTSDVMTGLGICYYMENRPKEAIDLFEKNLQMNPDDAVSAYYIGLCYKKSENYKKSIEYLKLASEIAEPYYLTDIYHHLGNTYISNKDYKKSIPPLKKAYELDPSKYVIHFELATAYDELQNSETLSLKYYNAFLKAVKKDSSEYLKLITYSEARIKELKEALALKNQNQKTK